MDPQRVGRVAFALIGLGLLAGAALAGWFAWQRHLELATHADWPRVDGVVASVGEARDGQGELFYWTTVSWSGPDGVEHEYQSAAGSAEQVGAIVPLRYDPANPAVAESPDARETWFPAMILGAMGSVFLGIAARSAVRG